MAIFLLTVGAVVWVVIRHRRRRKMLAGLVATRPVFSVEPPARRMHNRSQDRF